MALYKIRGGNAPVEFLCNGGVVTNSGPGTVYYSAHQDVTVAAADGFIGVGASTALEGAQFFVATAGSTALINVGEPLVAVAGGIAGFSDYTENKVLNHVFGKTAWTMPSVWIGLFTLPPSDIGGGTEATGGSYARKSTVAADWTAAAAGSISNATALTFVSPSGSWGTVTHFGLFDASTAGNMLAWNRLATPQTIATGNTVRFPAGSVIATLD